VNLLLLLLAAAAAAPAATTPRASARAVGHYLAARRAQAAGDWPRALEEFRLAIVFDDRSAQLRVAHAEALARLSRLEDAEAEASQAAALDPEGAPAADAWLLLGRIAAHRRDAPRAAEALRTAAALETRLAASRVDEGDRTPDPEPWQLLARVLEESGDEAGASVALRELGERLPAEAARGWREAARRAAEARDPARAERALRRAVEILPSDAEAWKRIGQIEEQRRRWSEARAAWEAALRAESDDLEALAALGRVSLRLGDLPAAQAYFRQQRHLDADEAGALASSALAFLEVRRPAEALALLDGWRGSADGRILFARGLVLEEMRRWPEAAAAFAAVQRDEGDLWGSARTSLAHALAQAGRHAEALRAADEAASARPGDVRVALTRAWVLERSGRGAEAADGLRRAVEARERDGDGAGAAELWDALAGAMARLGRAAEAVALLEGAAARRPRDQGVLYALGVAQERAGEGEAAVAQMRALLALNPDHAEALNFVGYAWAERGVRLEEAERLLWRALELRPENGYFLDSLGWVLFQKGDTERAVATLEQADRLAGPEPTILEHLGDAYRRTGRGGDALGAYRRALRSLDAGESQDGPQKAAEQRIGLQKKVDELSRSEVRLAP
jgi:tetratricopeptide (TPR) repeat protein